jgi:hypothetical protein
MVDSLRNSNCIVESTLHCSVEIQAAVAVRLKSGGRAILTDDHFIREKLYVRHPIRHRIVISCSCVPSRLPL